MGCGLTILGEPPFSRDPRGKLKSRIGTVFPRDNTLVTLPGIHATQREAYLEFLTQQRRAEGRAPLTEEEESCDWQSAVDLILEDNGILIRPDPDNMPLAFEADECLQTLVPKHRIKFLGVLNDKIRAAVEKQGEWWRITPLPQSPEELNQLIVGSRIALGGEEIYYYSGTTGTRFLTCQHFAGLGNLQDASLQDHLLEIQQFSSRCNAHANPELAFFAADPSFTQAAFAPHDFRALDSCRLRAVFATLRDQFFCRRSTGIPAG